MGFLGLPLWAWGLACLGLSVLYCVSWPQPRPGQVRPRWAHIVLRWFHALVWLLLAAACGLWAAGYIGGAYAAAWAALPVYLTFITVTLWDGRRR